MLQTIFGFINFMVLLFFGIYVAASFLDIEINKKNNLVLFIFGSLLGIIQMITNFIFGFENMSMIYPFITHLPLILFFIFYFKANILSSAFAVMSAYLCCQISKWFGVISLSLFEDVWVSYVVRILVTIPIWFFIVKYASSAIRLVLTKSRKTILIFGILPATYYFFDYAATVYTNLLYNGSLIMFEFLPFVLCVAYLVFSLVYFKEYEEKCETERRNQLMEIQRSQSIKEIESIKRSEYEITLIRHDMRHFLNNISFYIDNKDYDKANAYIQQIIKVADKTVIRKFCENEIVNMILSFYENRMNEHGIVFNSTVRLCSDFPCSEVDFSSILSNGLENAVQAVINVEKRKRSITLDLHMIDNKILLSIKNPYSKQPEFKNDVPVTDIKGHGLGTQSIKYLTEKLKGNCQFTAENGVFTLRVII